MLFPWKGSFLAHYQTAAQIEISVRNACYQMYFAFQNGRQIKSRPDKSLRKDAQMETEVNLYASLPFTSLGTFRGFSIDVF